VVTGALCLRFEPVALAQAMPLNPKEVGVIALKNILVATDFSEPAEAALRYGSELARRFNASLHVLHVVDDLAGHTGPVPGMPMNVELLQTDLEQDARANLETLVPEPDRTALHAHLQIAVSAWPGQAILGYARDEEIDLIIVGTHSRTGLARLFLGSVAQHIARSATCPVLTVRAHARDFIRPDALQKVEPQAISH
jgi:nucleotide-binding universal stress UspA family protein